MSPRPTSPAGQYPAGQYGGAARPVRSARTASTASPTSTGGQYGQPYGQAPPYGPSTGGPAVRRSNPAYGQPGGYGNQPYNPYGNQPYGSAEGQGGYAYSPYGTPPPYPAGLDDGGVAPTPRPGVMVGALVLLILSALPFLVVGALMVLAVGPDVLPPEILNDPRLAEAGLTPELLVSAVRRGRGGDGRAGAALRALRGVGLPRPQLGPDHGHRDDHRVRPAAAVRAGHRGGRRRQRARSCCWSSSRSAWAARC